MQLEVAKKIILGELEYVNHSPNFDEICFDFLGGEPFLRFDFIRDVVEWVLSQKSPIPILFTATTNGTIMDACIKEWLIKHRREFQVVLSYDGMDKTQDKNRSASSSRIDLSFFLENYPSQSVKMTVPPESVNTLSQDVISLVEKGAKVDPGFAHGVAWNTSEIEIYRKELFKLCNYFLSCGKNVIRQFEHCLSNIYCEQTHRFCGTGVEMVTYDINGKGYPCHMFTPFIQGFERDLADLEKDDTCLDSRCAECDFRNLCKTCYGMNLLFRQDVKRRSAACCRLAYAEIESCIYYKGMQYERKIKSGCELTPGDLLEIKAILQLNSSRPPFLED